MKKSLARKNPRFVSLKTKIILLTVSLSTLMSVFLGGYLVWKSYLSLRLQAEQAQLTVAKILAWHANNGLAQAFQSIQILSKRPETIYLNKEPLVRELTLVTTTTELVDGFMLLLPDGKIFAESLSNVNSSNFPPNDLFQEIIHRKHGTKNTISVDLYRTSAKKNRGVVLSTPVFRGSKLVGVLLGIIYLPNHTIGNLNTARFGKTGFAYMVNKDGVGIIHPNRNKWLTDLSDLPPVKAFQKNGEGVIQFKDEEGEGCLAAYTTVATTSWGVVVQLLAEECYAPATQMLQFMTVFLALALFISIYLSLILSEKVIQPILELADKVHGYEAGELDPRMAEAFEPTDEVGLLRRALDRMALTIQARTRERERAYARTLQAERKLAESERLATLGQFSAGLAHELNNPLAVILGAAQMARDTKGTRLQQWLDEIHREGERCRRLVLDLLNFAKPVQLKIKRLDLAMLILETWKQTAPGRQEYHLKLMNPHFHVLGDPDRLKQVFLNLFKNAVEAMPLGGEVRVDLKKAGYFNLVTVSDKGTGVLNKNMPKLFRPFFTTKPSGTGLGLSIARSILQAHQGTLTVERGKPRGVKISIRWPQKLKSQRVKNGNEK